MFSLAAKEAEKCSMLNKRALKTRFKEHLFKIKKTKQRKLIRLFINISG